MGKEEMVLFLSEKNRLQTFKKWIFSEEHSCNAAKMAEAGFIHIGSSKEPDLVKCFFCNKQLDGWEQDDNPWEEHVSHSSKCKFAMMRTPEGEMTLNQYLDLADSFGEKIITDIFDKKLETLDEIFKLAESKNSKH
ncbi:baculoviral IAP repeat-containing protein 5 [Coccinella septempunctata]|uniref:baculoviral IAP repeat-containing protein 5 n=1 Tax=Coccinella septempunctata TaxID=41139 RepID=UPI001D086F77|nr:baculoviral IAP repeat-containing protein 5 [Coccinella septempunctata]